MRRQFNQNVNGRKTVAWCSLFAGEFSLFFGYLCDVLKRARHTFPGSHAIFSSQTKTLYWFGILFFFADFFDLRERSEWKYELLVVYNVHVPLQKGEIISIRLKDVQEVAYFNIRTLSSMEISSQIVWCEWVNME